MDSIKTRSFVSTRIHLLAPEELRFTKEIQIEQRRGRTGVIPGGIIIARHEPKNGQSLRGLFERLANDNDMIERYIMTFDADTNRINIMFRNGR